MADEEIAETEFFTDSTQPRAYTGEMVVAIAHESEEAALQNRVEYALYSDTTTWTSWVEWAMMNAYDGTNWLRFSAQAI